MQMQLEMVSGSCRATITAGLMYVCVHRTVESEMSNGKLDDSAGLLLICS